MKRIQHIRMIAVALTAASLSFGQVAFTPITEGPLVEDIGNFFGINWADFDGDGLIDVLLSEREADKPLHLYRNVGLGTFEKVTDSALDALEGTLAGIAFGDQDNDGDLDLFVTTRNHEPDVFLLNDGTGTFSQVTDAAWIPPNSNGNPCIWMDYDNDGLLDLFIANESGFDYLIRNIGDGNMERINTSITMSGGDTRGVLWTDYDNDGDLDIFITGKDLAQYRNDGDNIFTPVLPEDGGLEAPPWSSTVQVGLNSADYDNDGDLDLYYIVWTATGADSTQWFYRNDGTDGFTQLPDVIPAAGAGNQMSGSWGDYDNDGYVDLYISDLNFLNQLYHNNGDATFSKVTDSPLTELGVGSVFGSWVDYDNDGDLDLFVTRGGESDIERTCSLFRNDGPTGNYLKVALVGTVSNRFGIGAKVKIHATIDGNSVNQLREFSGVHDPDSSAHFGLGDATVIDTLIVEWPSGGVQVMNDIPVNQFLTIEEAFPDWAGYPIQADGHSVDTGDFLGWMDVDNQPWIYCYDLGHWIYCEEEAVTETGAWVYMPSP